MSSHESQNPRLYDYLEGVLSSEERQEFERHLQDCSECRQEVHMVRRLDEVVVTLPEPELPEGFMERLRQGLDEVDANPGGVKAQPGASPVTRVEGQPPPRSAVHPARAPWLRPALALAAGLLLVLGIVWPRGPHPQPGTGPDSGGGQAASLAWVLAAAQGPVQVDGVVASTVRNLPAGTVLGASQRTLLVVGRSQVRLAPATRVRLTAQGLTLEKGRVYVAERGEQLRVDTPQAVVSPVGTDFDVSWEGGATRVRVWDGEVRVQPGQGQAISVRAGQELGVGEATPRSATPDDFVTWNTGLGPQPSPALNSSLPVGP